tara:strand:+ start:1693 stop:1851 length:159 start_codon:yes stop_codon:yes gene_type:complete
MKTFKDYFQDKIEGVPSWLSTLKKKKNINADLEGDPEEKGGDSNNKPTEKLE